MVFSMCPSENLNRLLSIAIYLFVFTYCTASGVHSTISSNPKGAKELVCTDVRYAYTARGFSNNDVPIQPISGMLFFLIYFIIFGIKY